MPVKAGNVRRSLGVAQSLRQDYSFLGANRLFVLLLRRLEGVDQGLVRDLLADAAAERVAVGGLADHQQVQPPSQ